MGLLSIPTGSWSTGWVVERMISFLLGGYIVGAVFSFLFFQMWMEKTWAFLGALFWPVVIIWGMN